MMRNKNNYQTGGAEERRWGSMSAMDEWDEGREIMHKPWRHKIMYEIVLPRLQEGSTQWEASIAAARAHLREREGGTHRQ